MSTYTPTWFDTFLRTYWPHQTEKELAFLTRHLPRPAYLRVLDVCCGNGRLALPLAALEYEVTGLDRDAAMIAEARRRAEETGTVAADFVLGDMRAVDEVSGTFDAVVCLWQSFGYFDAATNTAVLRRMAAKLRPAGRLLLDLYHRDYFVAHQGTATDERAGRRITTTRRMDGDRLTVMIDYGADTQSDTIEWQLFTPHEIATLAGGLGLRQVLACADFDETQPPTPAQPRMQMLFERAE
jgi:SAM-dependent methyltransferase